MGKIAFVFAGQGAQHTGMGLDLYQQVPSAAAVFERADKFRADTSEQCFHGDNALLSETKNTQPCLFVTELACAAALSDHGIKADVTAGFSLGELVALTYAGAADFDDMFRLVCKRGELMQQAAEEPPTAMVATLKLPAETVVEICKNYSAVYPVNFNCPGQVSVSGLADEIKDFSDAVKQAGGRAMPLKVKGGFHSPFMNAAAAALKTELARHTFTSPEIPVYANSTGNVYGKDIAAELVRQIISPVRWETIIRNMIDDGVDTFIEPGPGETLCGMIKRIDPTVRRFHVSDRNSLENLLSEVKP